MLRAGQPQQAQQYLMLSDGLCQQQQVIEVFVEQLKVIKESCAICDRVALLDLYDTLRNQHEVIKLAVKTVEEFRPVAPQPSERPRPINHRKSGLILK
jgi:hypothetical protein